jgi:hypothetical protein
MVCASVKSFFSERCYLFHFRSGFSLFHFYLLDCAVETWGLKISSLACAATKSDVGQQ